MSMNDSRQGQQDAVNNEPARNVQNKHWKVRQDYNAAYAAEKQKRS